MDRTTLLSRISDEYRAKSFRIFSDWRIAYNEPSYDIPDVAWDEVPMSILSIVEDKMMFLTAKGCPGIGREVVKREDFICILFGSEIPFLRRQAPLTPDFIFKGSIVFIVLWTERLNGSDEHTAENFMLV